MRKPTQIVVSALLTCALLSISYAQEATPEERLRELERKLEQATKQIEELNGTVRALRAEIDRIKSETAAGKAAESSDANLPAATDSAAAVFVERIVDPRLGAN